MLTGDRRSVAESIAASIGFTDFEAERLPEQKLAAVHRLKAEGHKVMVVGDGVNDAPALAAGDLSVAMGALGSDVAIQTADIALMASDLRRVPHFLALSDKTLRIINQNMLYGFLFIIAAIVLGHRHHHPDRRCLPARARRVLCHLQQRAAAALQRRMISKPESLVLFFCLHAGATWADGLPDVEGGSWTSGCAGIDGRLLDEVRVSVDGRGHTFQSRQVGESHGAERRKAVTGVDRPARHRSKNHILFPEDDTERDGWRSAVLRARHQWRLDDRRCSHGRQRRA